MSETLSREEVIQGTLDWCNARRREKGDAPLEELPKGVRGQPTSCPCGEATGLYVGYFTYNAKGSHLMPDGGGPKLPRPVVFFTRGFDEGRFPEFDANLGKGRI